MKAPGEPRSTVTRTASSASPAATASAMAAYMALVSAFFLSGRFMRMTCAAPRRSTVMWSLMSSSVYPRLGEFGRGEALGALDHPIP